jgi:hypothetical protein
MGNLTGARTQTHTHTHTHTHTRRNIDIYVTFHPTSHLKEQPCHDISTYGCNTCQWTARGTEWYEKLTVTQLVKKFSAFHRTRRFITVFTTARIPRPYVRFITKLEFCGEELFSARPTPQAGGPPLVGCPRLLIEYIHSYLPYLQAVSSICNPRMRHAVMTGTHFIWILSSRKFIFSFGPTICYFQGN